ncbi:MAG: hypothetical protein HY717_10725 [Planctomycetes bacterium]|nr:hypothetical protein [Planctomycetota bacterium]
MSEQKRRSWPVYILGFLGVATAGAVLLFFGPLAPAAHPAAAAQDSGKEKDGKEGEDGKPKSESGDREKAEGEKAEGEKKPAQKLSIEEEYVREHLKDHLHTNIEFLGDGRAKMTFNFREKNPDHETIFTPNIGKQIKLPFRWTVPGEEYWGYSSSISSRVNDKGIRIAMQGSALLNCWFEDEVEAEMIYLQRVTFSPKQTAALVFMNDSGQGIGNNFGTQCAEFLQGTPKNTKGKTESLNMENTIKIKLVVVNGNFEAHKNGRKQQAMEYSTKRIDSGRIGFIWGGGVASFISELTIVGKLDAKKMFKKLQGAKK